MSEEFETELRQTVQRHSMFLDADDLRDAKQVLEGIASKWEDSER